MSTHGVGTGTDTRILDSLILQYGRSYDTDGIWQAIEKCREKPLQAGYAELITKQLSDSQVDARRLSLQLVAQNDEALQPLVLMLVVDSLFSKLRPKHMDEMRSHLDRTSDLGQSCLMYCDSRLSLNANLTDRAEQSAVAALSFLGPADRSPMSDFVRLRIHRLLGRVHQEAGDFRLAYSHFEKAHRLANDHGFLDVLKSTSYLASLYWLSGQHKRAAGIHTSTRYRSIAEEKKLYGWLSNSHLSAAKCYIDAEDLSSAMHELKGARVALNHYSGPLSSRYQGYLALYSGEAKLLSGQQEEWLEQTQVAIRRFQDEEPCFEQGVLEARMSTAKMCLAKGLDHLFLDTLREAMRQADQRGIHSVRSRLLLMQSYVYRNVDGKKAPELKRDFNNLVCRLHMVNNPGLVLEALSNLHAFAKDHLPEDQREELHQMILNQKPLLEGSCFRSLYSEYVFDRTENKDA